MNADDISLKTYVYLDELAFLLCISETEVLEHENIGAIPPSEPPHLLGDTRRVYPRQKALEMWADWKEYCALLKDEEGTNHANH